MHKCLATISFIAVLLIVISCSQQKEIGDFHAVDADGWLYGDTLSYDLPKTGADSVWHGDIAIAIRHSAAYPYSNLWMELSYPPADKLQSDTLNVLLADLYGNWQGRGLGLSFQKVDTIVHDVTLSLPATLSLRHIMRSDKLTDVEQIGLIFISKN